MSFNELYTKLERSGDFIDFTTFSTLQWIISFSIIFIVILGLIAFSHFFMFVSTTDVMVVGTLILGAFIAFASVSTSKAAEYNLSANEKEALIQDYLSEKDNTVKVDIELYKTGDDFASGRLVDGQSFYLESDSVIYDLESGETPYYEYVPIENDIEGKKEYKAGNYNQQVHLNKK